MGWNKPSGNENGLKKPGKKQSGVFKGAMAGVVVVICAVAAWFVLAPGLEKRPQTEPAKAKPIADRSSKTAARAAATNRVESARDQKAAAVAKAKAEYVKRPGQMQLPDGKVLTFRPPEEGHVRKVYANGHMYECDHLGNWKDITVRPLFKTAFEENFLAMAAANKKFIPTFLMGLDETDVRKMLEKNYQLKGDETETEMERLKAYDEMRCAALSYMEEGGKFDDFVKEFSNFERKQRDARAMGMREMLKLYKEGKVAEAKEMAKAANMLMKEKGYKSILIPAHIQAEFDAIPDAPQANQ